MLSVVVGVQTFVVAGVVIRHPLPQFPEMRRGWTAEVVFGAGSCTLTLANSNGKVMRTIPSALDPAAASGFLFEADSWLVAGTDGSPTLIPFPGAFDPLSLRLETAAAEPEPLPACLHAYTKGVLMREQGVAWWEFALLDENGKLYGRAQGTTTAECGAIGGELAAAMRAARWASEHGLAKLVIHYENHGVENWTTGKWTARKPMPLAYARFMAGICSRMELGFRHVPTLPRTAVAQEPANAR